MMILTIIVFVVVKVIVGEFYRGHLASSPILAEPRAIPPGGEGSQKEVLVWELLRRIFFGLEALTPFSIQSSASILGVAISNNRHPPAVFEQLPGKLRSNDVICQLLNTFFSGGLGLLGRVETSRCFVRRRRQASRFLKCQPCKRRRRLTGCWFRARSLSPPVAWLSARPRRNHWETCPLFCQSIRGCRSARDGKGSCSAPHRTFKSSENT